MVAQYVVAAPKVENINFGWFSSGKLVAPKEDNIQPGLCGAHGGGDKVHRLALCVGRLQPVHLL